MARDAKTRGKAKALYEKGESLRDIAGELHIAFTSVKNWAKKEQWVKGKAAPKLAQREEAALEREAERHGVTKGKVFAKVAELMEAEKTEFYKGMPVASVTDNSARLGATNLAADILGMKKIQVDPSDEFRAFFGSLKGGAK